MSGVWNRLVPFSGPHHARWGQEWLELTYENAPKITRRPGEFLLSKKRREHRCWDSMQQRGRRISKRCDNLCMPSLCTAHTQPPHYAQS